MSLSFAYIGRLQILVFILSLDPFLEMLISCRSFLVDCFFLHKTMSSANKDALSSFFSICNSFSCFILLAKTLGTIKNSYGDSGHLRPILHFNRYTLSFSFLWNNVLSGFVADCIVLGFAPYIPIISSTFIMKSCWVLSKIVFESKEIILWFLKL